MTEERRIAERRERERRTMALRGPGAGGVAPESSVSASNPCLNCGTNIQLRFLSRRFTLTLVSAARGKLTDSSFTRYLQPLS